jgi:hypothetical protein
VGIPRELWKKRKDGLFEKALGPNLAHPNQVGWLGKTGVYSPDGPIPLYPFVWIETPKGARRLAAQEWMQIKGLPTGWESSWCLLKDMVQLPGVPKWNAIGDHLLKLLSLIRQPCPLSPLMDLVWVDPSSNSDKAPNASWDTWSWTPSDLTEGSLFFHACLRRFQEVTRELGGPKEWISDGIEALSLHHQNYGPAGAQKLAILWWEWLREYWTKLREGASMNFMKVPPVGLIPNTKMSDNKLPTVIKFVNELIDLGVVGPHDETIVNNRPLFIVAKSGQAGQWRCI